MSRLLEEVSRDHFPYPPDTPEEIADYLPSIARMLVHRLVPQQARRVNAYILNRCAVGMARVGSAAPRATQGNSGRSHGQA